MVITSAKFIKGVQGTDEILADGIPQIALIGRSNVGKSSVVNSLTNQKNLARTSSFPGRTREINIFLINNSFYLLDLPGYGFAKASREVRDRFHELIGWYLFDSPYEQKKVVLIIDAFTGLKDSDVATLDVLEEHGKPVVIVANKVDKIKKSHYQSQLQTVRDAVGDYRVIPYSAKKNIGVRELTNELLAK